MALNFECFDGQQSVFLPHCGGTKHRLDAVVLNLRQGFGIDGRALLGKRFRAKQNLIAFECATCVKTVAGRIAVKKQIQHHA